MRGLLNTQISKYDCDNFFDFPELQACDEILNSSYLDFDSLRSYRKSDKFLYTPHFFCDDYKFNCIWDMPNRYLLYFKQFRQVVMPDFSLYYDYPVALQIYNKYRNHWLARFWSDNGISVIPNISLSLPVFHELTIIGYPKNSIVAFSDIGIAKNNIYSDIVDSSFRFMVKELKPIKVLYFTRSSSVQYSDVDIINVPYLKGDYNG